MENGLRMRLYNSDVLRMLRGSDRSMGPGSSTQLTLTICGFPKCIRCIAFHENKLSPVVR